MSELFAHLEKKMGQFWEKYNIFPKMFPVYTTLTDIARLDFVHSWLLRKIDYNSSFLEIFTSKHQLYTDKKKLKKKTENCPQFSQNENIFVKMGEKINVFLLVKVNITSMPKLLVRSI